MPWSEGRCGVRLQGTFGSEDQRSNVAERSGEPGHRPWNSFASNSTAGDSPYIGAHYGGGALSRGGSGDLGAPDDDTLALRRSMLHTRSVRPSAEHAPLTPFWARRLLRYAPLLPLPAQ